MNLQKTKVKILKFPNNPEEIKWLMSQEEILMEALGIQDTYDERVETRKELRKVREELKSKISTSINT